MIDDTTPGNALHTESDEDDERIEVRQDFMDRVNEDIENDSDQIKYKIRLPTYREVLFYYLSF